MAKNYTFTPENNIGSSVGKKYTFTTEENIGKGYVPEKSQENNFLRTALQFPQGGLEATNPGIAAGLHHMLAMGEVFDPEEIERIREISEREGILFDEEAYMEAARKALGTIPTVSNIASAIEDRTGLPLEPKNWYQKSLRLGSLSGAFTKGSPSQKLTSGIAAPATSQLLQASGVPEPFADVAGLGVGQFTGSKTPAINIGKSKKPSGLVERQFESLKGPREVSQKKLSQINQNLENEFKNISDNIIKESPVGETFEKLKNDPTFKMATRELLDEAQVIADGISTPLSTKIIKKEMADMTVKNVKGYALGEYDKAYLKYMKEGIEDIAAENATYGELVEQYRKNNRALGEYFEPGSSKASNRAKRDALLDQNRAIASIIEKGEPELSNVFKTGNERWTKIMDAEKIDNFIGDIFKDKVDFKQIDKYFDKQGYDHIFKRALGEKGYKEFTQLMKDMSTTETPYKMLQVAKKKGFEDLYKTGIAFFLHPKLGIAKIAVNTAKNASKVLMNSILDKPKIVFDIRKGMKELKKGNFKEAKKTFKNLENENILMIK